MGTICHAGGRRWLIFLAGYSASRSFLICFSWTVEAIHLPPASDPDIFEEPLLVEKMNARALGLKRKRMDERMEKAWVKRKRPFLFIEAMKLCASPLA